MDEQALREQICLIGQHMHRFQFADGTSGNISARLGEDRFLVTPSGAAKGFMQPDQLIVVDLNGQKVDDSPPHLKPTSEILMHLEAYKKRPNVGGVVHAHPPYAVALTIAGVSMESYTLPESIALMGHIPITPYATPSSAENRDAISEFIETHDAVLLAYHGSLTVGRDVWTAYMLLETLEHTARITYLVHLLGSGKPLPDHHVQHLMKIGKGYEMLNPLRL